jgi:hypothetical protein
MNSACWRTRGRASLGTGSLRSSQAGLRPQYARAGPLCSAELSMLLSAGGQAVAVPTCPLASAGITA